MAIPAAFEKYESWLKKAREAVTKQYTTEASAPSVEIRATISTLNVCISKFEDAVKGYEDNHS